MNNVRIHIITVIVQLCVHVCGSSVLVAFPSSIRSTYLYDVCYAICELHTVYCIFSPAPTSFLWFTSRYELRIYDESYDACCTLVASLPHVQQYRKCARCPQPLSIRFKNALADPCAHIHSIVHFAKIIRRWKKSAAIMAISTAIGLTCGCPLNVGTENPTFI